MLDALRARKDRFLFEDSEIALKPSTMMFITMNPGYPGRAELPESVKVKKLKRPGHDGLPGASWGHSFESGLRWT